MNFKETSFKDAIAQILDLQRNDALKERIFGTLELEICECDEENRDWAEYLYKKQECHLNPYNGVHGGIACTIADSCMGTTISAATLTLPSTADISISFLEPMTAEEYIVRVDIRKKGKTLVAAEAEIREKESGKLCVIAMSKFVLLKKDILADEKASKLLKEQQE